MNALASLATLQASVDNFIGATEATPLSTLPDWGSLTVLLIIVHFEDTYQITLTGAQIRACPTVGDLLALIPSRA